MTARAIPSKVGLGEAAKRAVGTGVGHLPDMSAFASSLTPTSGWYKQPSGVIVQYGYATTPAGTGTTVHVNLPIPFPVACIGVTPVITSAVISPDLLSAYFLNPTTTGFDLVVDTYSSLSGGRTMYWEAKGY
ncbi:gp53-like domain-containing protein [Citrobacter portucalensis]|uniref:gp53-like domain-containing protein n=1 Tax=Citrobacter portucalensis TaxID=1639133 RepID=UPI0040433945